MTVDDGTSPETQDLNNNNSTQLDATLASVEMGDHYAAWVQPAARDLDAFDGHSEGTDTILSRTDHIVSVLAISLGKIFGASSGPQTPTLSHKYDVSTSVDTAEARLVLTNLAEGSNHTAEARSVFTDSAEGTNHTAEADSVYPDPAKGVIAKTASRTSIHIAIRAVT